MPTVWIFDLDNTLHDAEPYIFPEMNRLMSNYMVQHTGLSQAEADVLRILYWQRYGTTLSGLLRHHSVKAEHFLYHTHQFPNLQQQLRPMRALHAVLRQLAGRKILFTNAPEAYARAVLHGLRITHYFDGLIAIQHTDFRPKPHFAGYRHLLQRYKIDPRDCVMVEDTRNNLYTAKRLGMRTVWLNPKPRQSAIVDLALHQLSELPNAAKQRGWL
ncbi:pyrimidine 5'-nucleotidase [Chitinimonas sp. BJB300]|uniref:pyrimidine 5'-nucleotidase n=1 Tax=Chitinimonas sp. BJB300 TaxID=1559339 RepID=UPI000C0DBA5B|nr:pyrimidine 5'-nucleotidase [Chitinimonas sp. BJB300]PHV12713.1 pyrimidine 5'-nucleotidase [Chitinimonas sp. BJB300]TSJ90893.1 pyrimidine 5'-nucleotidase [Chitinimonas sp. BJB300]